MNKKALAAAVLVLALVLAAAAQNAPTEAPSDAMDVVVLLDSSQSVLPYFQDVTDYLLSSVVRDFLRFGDTFHLISFGDTAQTEIAQKLNDERDVKSVLGRLYLLYPLARRSDFLGALGYLEQYLSDLAESRRKVVIIVTDGVHNPPPDSQSASYESSRVASEIESTCSSIRSRGWDLRLVRLPFAPTTSASETGTRTGSSAGSASPGQAAVLPGGATASGAAAGGAGGSGPAEAGGSSYFDVAAKALGSPVAEFSADARETLARRSLALPSVTYPDPLGKRGYRFSFPLAVENGSDAPVGLELQSLFIDGVDVLDGKSFLKLQPATSGTLDVRVAIPESVEPGEKRFVAEPRFAGGQRVDPPRGALELTLRRAPLADFFRSGARVLVFALFTVFGLALALLVVLVARRLSRRAEGPVVAAVLDSEAETSKAAAPRAAADETPAGGGAASAARVAGGGAGASAHLPRDEHETAIEREASEMAESAKAESSRAADLLAQAAANRGSAAFRDRIAAFKARRGAPSRGPRPETGDSASRVVKPGTMRVELRVEDQNPHIGMRNVLTMHSGGMKTVGGGRSDFLVFLVPAAKRAAELRFDGEILTFAPRRPELFPLLDGPVEDCLDQEILMLGRGGYPLVLRFVRYERPADRINRLLHCIETPGLFESSGDET